MAGWDYQFVDRIAADATVRLDLKSSWHVTDATEFPPPELRRASSSTMLADGEHYSAAAYDNRVLVLSLRAYDGASSDSVATAFQALSRQLDRPANIFRYRPGTSEPVFFRTFRCGPERIRWSASQKTFQAEVPAEPFALGLKETIGPVNVTNRPSSSNNGLYLDLTTVKGDVETPLRVSMPVTDNLTAPGQMSVLAVRRRGTPSAAPFVLQAEAMDQLNDTSTMANSSSMSGSGNNYSRVTFATTTNQATRLSLFEWPAAPSTDVRGRYRVFALVRKSVAGDAIDLWLRWGRPGSAPTYSGDAVRAGTAANRHILDLGLISFPVGPDPVCDGLSGAELPVRGQSIAIDVARVSGTGTLDIDYLLFVPADDRLMIVAWNNLVVDGSEMAVVDGTTEQVYGLTSGGAVFAAAGSSGVAGGFPMATPGATNRLYLLRSAGQTSLDLVANTTSVTVDYWPRYLHVRPVAS